MRCVQRLSTIAAPPRCLHSETAPFRDLLPKLAKPASLFSYIYNRPTSEIQMCKVIMLSFWAAAGGSSPFQSTTYPIPASLYVCLSFFHSLVVPARSITKLGRAWHTVITDCPVFLQVLYPRNLIEKHIKGH